MRFNTLSYGAVGAGATGAAATIPTNDDNYDRGVCRLYVNPTIAGVIVNLLRTGFVVASIDCSRFSNGNAPVPIDELWPATLPIQVQVQNTTGSSVSPQIVVGYEPIGNPTYRPYRPVT